MPIIDIEFFHAAGGQVVDRLLPPPVRGLAVTGTATAAGARPLVPAGDAWKSIYAAVIALDAPVYVAAGIDPIATALNGVLVAPGAPRMLAVNAGDKLSFIAAAAVARGDTIGQVVIAGAAQLSTATATIASGAALSGAVDCGTARLAKINMPAAWTAANITLQTSADGVTYRDCYDAQGTEYSVVAAASRSIILALVDFLGTRFVKVRSGTAVTPVNQAAARDIELVLVP
jgi:hypothetical protein